MVDGWENGFKQRGARVVAVGVSSILWSSDSVARVQGDFDGGGSVGQRGRWPG